MPTLTLTVGPPGAGKTTWARTQPGRLMTTDPIRTQRVNPTAFLDQLADQVTAALRHGDDVIVDACATQSWQRREWLRVARRAGARAVLAVHAVPIDVARRRNRARSHPVPDRVVRQQHAAMTAALTAIPSEGWDDVHHITTGGAVNTSSPGYAWRGGSTRAWRRLRAQILARDLHLCQLRIPGVCTQTADCVHHTHGRNVTGDDPRYLAAACTPCNLHIGDPTRHDPAPRPVTQW